MRPNFQLESQMRRTMPTSNPIRAPTPDPNFQEKIPATQSPSRTTLDNSARDFSPFRIDNRDKKIQELELKNAELERKIEDLNYQIFKPNRSFIRNTNDPKYNPDFLLNQINEYRMRIAELETNLEKATLLVRNKIQEADEWRSKFLNSSKPQPISSPKRTYEEERELRSPPQISTPSKISTLIEENEDLKNKITNLYVELFANKCEIERLSQALKPNSSFDSYKFIEIKEENKTLKEQLKRSPVVQISEKEKVYIVSLENDLKQLSEAYQNLLKEYETQKSIDKAKNGEIKFLTDKLKDKERELVIISTEIDRIKFQNQPNSQVS